MKHSYSFLAAFMLAPAALFAANPVIQIPMDVDAFGRVKENISNSNLNVYGHHNTENVAGAVGNALRFDGYSTYIQGNIPAYSPTGSSSFSVWVAPETYPIVKHDVATTEKITIAGNFDNNTRQGWRFALDKNGKYGFECFSGGWLTSLEADDILPTYEWSYLVAVNDTQSNKLSLYRNGDLVAQSNSLGVLYNDSNIITIGKTNQQSSGSYLIDTFNGLIDDVTVYDGAISGNELAATPQNRADLSIPSSRFENDLMRPKYHGMPGANWTNECHGLTFFNGKYHLFFQKNANGPFMSRLHWGHLSSDNLYEWTEEKIAIAPGESYDTKGCWSGCVFTDDIITGGKPNIIYTGVDYEKAYIVQASPLDENLIDWENKGVIINGRPNGLSDDFRDPYFFRDGDNAYIIVGTAKNGIGATTLHKYNAVTNTWSNDGKIFFAGTSIADHGTFWEMPNITPMGNGKWLFTVTPQATSTGVRTLYWIGSINSDGTFSPDSPQASNLELISQQGYGLLSPTIYQIDGKTLLLGIVPDKLSTEENVNLGWAHLYSFPREISIDENNNLIQKPFSSLDNILNESNYSQTDFTLDGVQAVSEISGRQFEVKGKFIVGANPFGFNIFKNSKGYASITYTPSTNRLEINFTNLNRKINDAQSFGGRYATILPDNPEPGSEFLIDAWVDGSIIDIFINEKWATSVRVFPTDNDAVGVELVADKGPVNVKEAFAGMFENRANTPSVPAPGDDVDDDTGVEKIFQDLPQFVNVYNLSGVIIKHNVKIEDATIGLPQGIYLINGHKVLVK